MAINYSEKIPNNVNLTDDRTLRSVLRSCIDLATTIAYTRPWNPPRVPRAA